MTKKTFSKRSQIGAQHGIRQADRVIFNMFFNRISFDFTINNLQVQGGNIITVVHKQCVYINPLKTKRRLLYLKTQFVPRSKHFSSRL